ncbi:MAG: hypothetical protein ACO24Y_07340 [Hylemonella sp.]
MTFSGKRGVNSANGNADALHGQAIAVWRIAAEFYLDISETRAKPGVYTQSGLPAVLSKKSRIPVNCHLVA